MNIFTVVDALNRIQVTNHNQAEGESGHTRSLAVLIQSGVSHASRQQRGVACISRVCPLNSTHPLQLCVDKAK